MRKPFQVLLGLIGLILVSVVARENVSATEGVTALERARLKVS